MKNRVLLLSFYTFCLLQPNVSLSQTSQWSYDYLGTISSLRFLFPEGVLSGSYAEGKNDIEITIQDCGKYVGQLCICAAAGFRVATLGIDALFSENETPTRSDFYLITSKDHMVSDVVKYILGLNRRIDTTKAQYFVDPSIQTKHRHWHYYIVRKDNHRGYQIIYNKRDLIPYEENEKLKGIEERFEQGLTSNEEEDYFSQAMGLLVEDILKGKKDHLFALKPISYSKLKEMFPYLPQ